jgi:hypothetical protein
METEFLAAIQSKGFQSLREFVSKEGSRDKKTLVIGDKTYQHWLTGIRPISFFVQVGDSAPVVLFQVPD